MEELRASFRRIDITPAAAGSPLLGYFTPRFSQGVLDPLHCRLASFHQGSESLLFVQVDTCLLRTEDAQAIAAAASRGSGTPADRVMVFASHTHTAPAVSDLYEVRKDAGYLSFLLQRIAEESAALQPPVKVTTFICRGRAPGLASNRRWYLKDGRVVTNPPRAHPALDRPEGPVDDEVNTVAFLAEDGVVAGMLVSIANHADTIGGSLVSADWPGLLEGELRVRLAPEAVVIPMIGAAGNINHFDFHHKKEQTRYAEARRLARAYARAVAESFLGRERAAEGPLGCASVTVEMPGRGIPPEESARARTILAETPAGPAARDLTAEDIFAGDPAVERFFAAALIELAERGPSSWQVPLQAFRLGSVAFLAVPGEPFVEIGLTLKRLAGFELVVPVCLANGYLGYIPVAESFDRGGYEVRPGPSLLCREAAQRITAELARLSVMA